VGALPDVSIVGIVGSRRHAGAVVDIGILLARPATARAARVLGLPVSGVLGLHSRIGIPRRSTVSLRDRYLEFCGDRPVPSSRSVSLFRPRWTITYRYLIGVSKQIEPERVIGIYG
jgi:hypothetical protein